MTNEFNTIAFAEPGTGSSYFRSAALYTQQLLFGRKSKPRRERQLSPAPWYRRYARQ
jgi:hypothetical protein